MSADQPRVTAAACIKATNSIQRRRILRFLHLKGEAQSPNELANGLSLPLSHTSYHIKVLKECGVIALTDTGRKRGAREHFYTSTVSDHELIKNLLGATREDDE